MPAGARRARFDHEVAAHVNFAAVEEEVDRIAERLRGRVTNQYEAAVTALEAHLGSFGDVREASNFLAELGNPARAVDWPGLTEALGDAGEIGTELRRALDDGAAGVWAEARAQGVPVTARLPELPEVDRDSLDAGRRRIARLPAERIAALGSRFAYDNPVFHWSPEELVGNVRDHLREQGVGPATAVRSEVQKAHGVGRQLGAATVARPSRIYASELLDRNTCGPCSLVDGREYASEAAARLDYPTGIYRACDGGDRCRGTLVFVWGGEAPPTEGGLPPPPVGRGGRPGDPIVDLGSDPLAPRYALNRQTLRDVHGVELTEGQRVRLLGGKLHNTPLTAGYVELRRGRLLYVGDGYPDTDAVFRTLDGLTDRIPEGMGDALDLLAAHAGRKQSLTGTGDAMASSNGTEVVYWQRYVLDDPDTVGAIFDHEFGHSIISNWNRGAAGRLRTLDEYPNPNDAVWRVGGTGMEPGPRWVEAMRADAERAEQAFRRHAELMRRARRDLEAEGRVTAEGRVRGADIERRVELLIARMRPANRDAMRTLRTRFGETDRPPGEHRLTPNGRGSWDGKAGDGVSDYGASEPAEDWAEAFARYQRDGRTGRLGRAPAWDELREMVTYDAGSDTTFRHLFPHRAELLDALHDAYRRAAAGGGA